ncbi:ATP-binding protein [Oceanithermus sp.]
MANDCKVLLLGPPLIRCRGEPWMPPTSRGLALIAYLLGKKEGESRHALVSLLWDTTESTGRHRLRQELYRLHTGPLRDHLDVQRERVRLQGVASDTQDFLRHLDEGDWRGAISLWRGSFMEGFGLNQAEAFEDWLLLERETWCNRLILALSRRALELEAAGDLSGAAADWRAVLNCDPLHEESLKQLMRVLSLLGRWPEIEEVLASYRSRVQKELGLPPDPEVLNLYERLKLNQAPPQPASAPLPLILQNPPLVGRGEVLEVVESSRQPVLIKGEAGSGKSRLAQEVRLRLGGKLTVEHGAPTSSLPYAGIVRALESGLERQPEPPLEQVWLREAGRLVPHKLPSPSRPIANATEQARFVEGVARTLLQLAGPVLVWEDLQWTDPQSLEVLSLLLSLAPQTGTRLLITLRWPPSSKTVRDWLRRCSLSGDLREVELAPLSEAEIQELIRKMAHQESGVALFARRLHAATGGNPFFVIETLRQLFAGGELKQGKRGWSTVYDRTTSDYRELPLPNSVREALRTRVSTLENQLRRSLQLVALSQEPVTASDLAAVLGISEMEAASHLEALLEHQLLRSQEGGFTMAHDHLRQLLLDTQLASIPAYHRAWARALASRGKLALSAEHWLASGDKARAAVNLLAAARQAAPRATLAALALYERALELEEWLPEEEARKAKMELYELRLRLNRLEQTDLEALAELADDGDPLPRLLLAEAALQRGDYQQARKDAALGLELAIAQRNRAQEARAHFILAWIHYRYGDPEAQLEELEKALRAFEESGDVYGQAKVLRNLAALNYRLGRKEEGDRLQKKAERLTRQTGDPVMSLRLRADRTTGMWLRGEYPDALRAARRLLADARRLGDLGGILDGLELVGLSLHKLGDDEAALGRFNEFVELADRFNINKDLALALSERALPLIELSRWEEAGKDLDRALEIQERIGDQAKLGHTYYTYGYLYYRRGEPARAQTWLLRAAAHWRARGELGHLARSLALAAIAAGEAGEGERAKNFSADALSAARSWTVGVPDLPLVYAAHALFHENSESARTARALVRSVAKKLRRKRREQYAASFVATFVNGL